MYYCRAFGCGKKFEECLLIWWIVAVLIFLGNIFDCESNLFINNILRDPVIDEIIFMFLILYKILFVGRRLILHGMLGY